MTSSKAPAVKARSKRNIGRPVNNITQATNSPFKRLRLQAGQAGLSQEQLAQEIGVAVSTIRRWEKGQAEPTMTVAQMRNFCRAVKRNLADLPRSLTPLK